MTYFAFCRHQYSFWLQLALMKYYRCRLCGDVISEKQYLEVKHEVLRGPVTVERKGTEASLVPTAISATSL